jgi:hypothetical protein
MPMLNQLFADLKETFWQRNPGTSSELLPPATLMRSLASRPALSGYLPYSAYLTDEQIFVNQDSLGFCLELKPQSGADEEMAQILAPLFAGSRAGAGIQLHLLGSPHIQSIMRRYANLRLPDPDNSEAFRVKRAERQTNIYRTMARARAGFFLEGAARPAVLGCPLRNFRLVLSATMPGNPDDLTHLEELILMREAMRTTLRAAGFPQSRLGRVRVNQLGVKPVKPSARRRTRRIRLLRRGARAFRSDRRPRHDYPRHRGWPQLRQACRRERTRSPAPINQKLPAAL